MGMPNCLIMANTSFFACSQYDGDPLRFLKTRNPSSCFTKMSMKSDDKTSHAVIFLPWVLYFRTAKNTLSLICFICNLFNFQIWNTHRSSYVYMAQFPLTNSTIMYRDTSIRNLRPNLSTVQ